MNAWRAMFKKHQDKLPKGASPKQRGEATKAASAEYRGGKAKTTRSNPSEDELKKILIVGAVLGAGYLYLQAQKQAQTAQTPSTSR